MKGRDISEDISEWEQIQDPSTSTDNSPTALDPMSVAWTPAMVMGNDAEDGHSSGSPPNQHEDLQVNLVDNRAPENPPSLVLPLSSDSSSDEESGLMPSQSDSSQSQRNEPHRLLNFRVLSSGFIRLAYRICNYAVYARRFWSIMSLTGIVAAVIFIKMQTWRRRRAHQQTIDHLRFLLREKNEKIRQLLLQIAQIHEALSVPRKVAVLRIRR